MTSTAGFDAATEVVRRVLRFEEPADAVVSAFFRENRSLGARDRPIVADTLYAVLRRLALYRHLADAKGASLHRRLAALGWQGSAETLRAALSAVDLEWLRGCEQVDVEALPEPLRHNLPEWIAVPLHRALGAEFAAWVTSMDSPAPLDLRVNALKAKRADVLARLRAEGLDAQPTPYSPWGLRVDGKPSLQRLSVFTQGLVEVQDEGSQLLALLTGARRGEIVVDFCAGAGGKTLALGAQMRNTGRLYAFDVSGHRLALLRPRAARAGLANVHPTQIAHERDERIERLAGKADRVLVDAPCTGSGTLRRHPDLKWRQSAALLAGLGPKQRAILAAAARLVKPGGSLVYATCSVLESENEAVAGEFDSAHASGFTRLPAQAALEQAHVEGAVGLVTGENLRLWTHRHGTDGFFAAVWQRR